VLLLTCPVTVNGSVADGSTKPMMLMVALLFAGMVPNSQMPSAHSPWLLETTMLVSSLGSLSVATTACASDEP
jgi:hypothetical protein